MSPAFEIGERVNLRGADTQGVVRMCRWDGAELDYFVTWWIEDRRFCEWLRADEIGKVPA